MEMGLTQILRKGALTGLLSVATMLTAWANTTEEVEQASGTVTLSTDVDYVITSATPFATGAVVNITNPEKAVVILTSVRPSKAKSLLSHIQINGEAASANGNCLVKIYADGSIIIPIVAGVKPLTVYTENDLQGDTEGYDVSTRVSLQGKDIDNRICSFKLRRGYMAWFAQKSDGTGYNRIWIADKSDITVNMPAPLRRSVSALRVSKWNDTSKKGYAGWDPTPNTLLNTTWCYNWDAGVNVWDDREYVTQHHHEGWPGIADVGNNGTSANILGNNEPDNTGDDREQVNTVDEVLKTWPEMMATGRRLGSPAMAGNLTWLYSFMDSIDARGWRCDYVVMHCYWYSDWNSWESNLRNVHNRTGRPIWITEMNYGANWTGWPGSNTDGSAANYAIELQHLAPIIDGLEATPWLERYAIYNWVQDCRKVWDDTKNVLTPAGEYYANKPSNLAYNSSYVKIPPVVVTMKDPDGLSVVYDKGAGVSELSWRDYNGEYNYAMYVERKTETEWEVLAEMLPSADGSYTYTDENAVNGCVYRIHIIDGKNKERYSRSVAAISLEHDAGETVNMNGVTGYLGGNLFVNGDFDLGLYGFTNGLGEPLSQPKFAVISAGSIDDGEYLQAWGAETLNKEGSIKTVVEVTPGANYYYASSARNTNLSLHYMYLTSTGEKGDSTVAADIPTNAWTTVEHAFNAGTYSKAMLGYNNLNATAQMDKIFLCRVFDTREEALADGIACLRRRAEAVMTYLAEDTDLVKDLSDVLSAVTGSDEEAYTTLKDAVSNALAAAKAKSNIAALLQKAEAVVEMQMDSYEALEQAIEKARSATSAADILAAEQSLTETLDEYLMYEETSGNIKNPSFAPTATGWTTKCGTYTAGEQKNTTLADKTCYRAFWSGFSAEQGDSQTMEVKQNVSGLAHGLYSLECKATTDHFCLSDQHGYLYGAADSVETPRLTADYLDIATVPNTSKWQTLSSPYIYINDEEDVTVGFVGSKQNAVDKAWYEIGNKELVCDMREGWWAATDFVLDFIPIYRRTMADGEWSTICLPYNFTTSSNVKLYQITGITSDYQNLCLTEVSGADAGIPHVYRMTGDVAWFYESGEPVEDAVTTSNKFRGNFMYNTRMRVGFYALNGDGSWFRVTSDNRPYFTNFGGCLTSVLTLPVYESWTEATMPISGAAEEVADGIEGITPDAAGETEQVYTVGGRQTNTTAGGLNIRVRNGKTIKVVRK